MSKKFKPQDHFRYKRLRNRWQRPIGLQSKLREHRKGAGLMPTVGYRTPRKFRGLERGVLKAVVVKTPADVANARENEGIIISSGVGKRKVIDIMKAAEQRGIKVLNLKSARAAKKREEEIMKKKEQKAKGKKEEKKPVEAKQEPKDGEKMKHEEKK